MVLAYEYSGALYINLTNLCTNKCAFCIREHDDGVYSEEPLWLEREPTREEVLAAAEAMTPKRFREIVFCGYGEPTCRLHDMLWLCRRFREIAPGVPIRLNTNGHANLIFGENVTPLFEGLFDVVSVSMNAADSDRYNRVCHPRFGDDTFPAVLKFIRDIQRHVPEVIVTVVRGSIPDADIPRCADLAKELNAKFRVREYI